jgi:hypothetical protein
MTQNIKILLLGATGLATLVFVSPASSSDLTTGVEDVPPATVGVFARHAGGKIVYHYPVTNNSQLNITAVTIGRDDQNDGNPANDVNELVELPSGYTAKLGIPSASSNSPTGWRVSVLSPEDTEAHAIAWEIMNEHSPQIRTGQTDYKMRIALDEPDNNYLTAHALVTFDDTNPETLTVPLEQLDVTPPELTVILTPDTVAAHDNKFVAIKASFILKDDYDHMPEIRLESITSNEILSYGDIRDASYGLDDRYFKVMAASKGMGGRTYTVTYSATDASGNQTVSSATVLVTPASMDTQPETGNTDTISQ